MKTLSLIVGLSATALLTGCAMPPDLAWNHYDNHLYNYYGQKMDQNQYMETLLATEKEVKDKHILMSPGIYAEIGTLYLKMGKKDEAIQYYHKEGDTWVQAKPLMDTLIAGIQRTSKKSTDGTDNHTGEAHK